MVSRKDIEKVRKNIQKKKNDAALKRKATAAINDHIKSENVFKKDSAPKARKAFRDTKLGQFFCKNPLKLIKDYLKKTELAKINLPGKDYVMPFHTRRKLIRASVAVAPLLIMGGVGVIKGEKAEDKLQNQSHTIAVENSTSAKNTLTASNITLNKDTISFEDAVKQIKISSEEITQNLAYRLIGEDLKTSGPYLTKDKAIEAAKGEFAKLMIEEKANTLANFDLSNRTLSAEELQMIKPCALGDKVVNQARKRVKSPRGGGQCLVGVRDWILSPCGIKLNARGSAYKAIDALRKHEGYMEIKCDIKNLDKLPRGCIVVWDRGTGNTRNGHISVSDGAHECSDGRWSTRKSLHKVDRYTGKVTGTYGGFYVFAPNTYTMAQDLTQSLYAENRASEDVTNQIAKKHNLMVATPPLHLEHITLWHNYMNKDNRNLLTDTNKSAYENVTSSEMLSQNNTKKTKKINTNLTKRNVNRGNRA